MGQSRAQGLGPRRVWASGNDQQVRCWWRGRVTGGGGAGGGVGLLEGVGLVEAGLAGGTVGQAGVIPWLILLEP